MRKFLVSSHSGWNDDGRKEECAPPTRCFYWLRVAGRRDEVVVRRVGDSFTIANAQVGMTGVAGGGWMIAPPIIMHTGCPLRNKGISLWFDE